MHHRRSLRDHPHGRAKGPWGPRGRLAVTKRWPWTSRRPIPVQRRVMCCILAHGAVQWHRVGSWGPWFVARNPPRDHSATAGYPARSSKLLDFDGKSARMGMASCLITVISPSDTVGHIASYGIPNATMRRFRNRSQNGAERRQPRWRLIEYSPILLVRVVS